MIDFSCHCGYRFSVPQDLAGGLVQCPQCKRLNDVPLLSDLQHIDTDGIYKLDEAPNVKADPNRVTELTHVFTRERFDDDGMPIDNRAIFGADPQDGGEGILPLADEKPTPKYDPTTGELIREVDVKPDTSPDPSSIPMARMAPQPPPKVINGMDVPEALELVKLPMQLLSPINVLVMFFILLAQFLSVVMMGCVAAFYLLLFPFVVGLQLLIVAHFGNVIDETGPESKQELPTPLRTADVNDDILAPMWQVMTALAMCYGPSMLLLFQAHRIPVPAILALSGTLAIIGTLLFPATVLTTMTSGTSLNLRPDRIVGVAKVCGAEYLLTIFAWAAGIVFYLAGLIGVNWLAMGFMNETIRGTIPKWLTWYAAYGTLCVGIYLLHLMCWQLGTLYRKHHMRFPWLYQRHHSERKSIGAFPVARPPRVAGQRGTKVARPLPPTQQAPRV